MIRKSIFFLMLILYIPAWAQNSKTDMLYEQSLEQYQKGNIKKALDGILKARTEYIKEENYERALTCAQDVAIHYEDIGDGLAAEKVLLETIALIPQETKEQLVILANLNNNLAYNYSNILSNSQKALDAYTESMRFYERAGLGNTADWAAQLENKAKTYFSIHDYQSALKDMLLVIPIYENDDNTKPEILADAHRTVGLIYLEMSYKEKALINYVTAIEVLGDADKSELKATLLNDIGGTHMMLGNFQPALDFLEEALVLNEELYGKDGSHYCMALSNIAKTYKASGDLETAMEYYKEITMIYEQTPPEDSSDLISLLIEIAEISDGLSLTDLTEESFMHAHNVAEVVYGKNSLEEADIYMAKANIAFDHDQPEASLTLNFKALDIMKKNNYPENAYYAQIYNNIGLAYSALNDFTLALQYNNEARDLYLKLNGPNHASVAGAIGNVGLCYEANEDYKKAIEYLKESVGIRLKTQDPSDEEIGRDYLNIGLAYIKNNEIKSGVEYLEKANVIYNQFDKNIYKAMTYNRLALGYSMLNNIPKAMEYNQKAIIANDQYFEDLNFDSFPKELTTLDYYELIVSCLMKVDLYVKKGDESSLLKGIAFLESADKILKDKAVSISNATDRLGLSQLYSSFTESGIMLVNKLHQVTKNPIWLEKAFYFSERSKANELFADIQKNRAASLSRIPKKTTDLHADLGRRMNTLQQQVALAYSSQNKDLISKLKAQESDLTKEINVVQTSMENAVPKFKSAINQRELPSWTEVRKHLDSKTAFVSYIITESAKFILIGNASRLVIKSIPADTDIDKLVRGFTNQVKFQMPGLQTITNQLTDLIWTPVEDALTEFGPIEKIIIIPDGPLNYLPFEALGKDQYLIEKYSIYYQLSGALIANEQATKVGSKPSFIALAPVFEDKETNFLNKSCERFVDLAKKADTTSRAFSINGDYISPLPETETEVKAINKIYVDKGFLSKSFIKEVAREELIKKGELADYDYIHLATHGFVNSQYPELSGLLLTQDSTSSEDGILYTGEILGLTLKAELVTLSACETALGKRIEGEGVRGLTTAFLFAGARTVISSLWKVADSSTSLLMIDFYNQLNSGKDKAGALRAAKQNLIKGDKYNHPYYWAPFIQIGAN